MAKKKNVLGLLGGALAVFAGYKLITKAQGAKALQFKITKFNATKKGFTIDIQIFNPTKQTFTIDSIAADILLNGTTVGFIQYISTEAILPKQYTEFKNIKINLDPLRAVSTMTSIFKGLSNINLEIKGNIFVGDIKIPIQQRLK